MRFGNTIDFDCWAVVSYNDDTGLGRQAADMRKVLGIGHFFVLPSHKLNTKPLAGPREHLVPVDTSEDRLMALLDEVQGIFFLERLTHHLPLVCAAKKREIMIACVPNWEHFAGWLSLQNQADVFLCPSGMTYRIVRIFGFSNAIRVPCPVDLEKLPARRITGNAKLFVHNGGTTNKDDRKSTREVIEAFKRVPRSDIRLLVRLQKMTDLPELDSRIQVQIRNLKTPSELYAEGDVAIQPSKLEGIGLSILEAAISGLPVITTDYAPMNEVVRDRELLCKVGWRYERVKTTKGIYHSHLRRPDIADLANRIEWCAENDMHAFSEQNLTLRDRQFSPEVVREQWKEALQATADGRLPELRSAATSTIERVLTPVTSTFFRSVRAFFQWRKNRSSGRAMRVFEKNGGTEGPVAKGDARQQGIEAGSFCQQTREKPLAPGIEACPDSSRHP